MKKVKLQIIFDKTKEEFDAEAEFSDVEITCLENFCRHASELRDTKIVSEGYPQKLNITWTSSSETNIETEDIDAEFISSFLHKLRPLILSREPFSFERISGMIRKKFTGNPGMERQLKIIRHMYATSEFSKYGQITIGGIPIFKEETLKLWLNSSEYHQDKDKKELMRHIEDAFTTAGTKALFVSQLRDKAYAIFKLEELASFIRSS